MTDNVVPGTFTPNYTSRNRVTRPPMYTHGGSSFPRVIMPFGQGHRVSCASYQNLVLRSGFSFLVPDLTYRFITMCSPPLSNFKPDSFSIIIQIMTSVFPMTTTVPQMLPVIIRRAPSPVSANLDTPVMGKPAQVGINQFS